MCYKNMLLMFINMLLMIRNILVLLFKFLGYSSMQFITEVFNRSLFKMKNNRGSIIWQLTFRLCISVNKACTCNSRIAIAHFFLYMNNFTVIKPSSCSLSEKIIKKKNTKSSPKQLNRTAILTSV